MKVIQINAVNGVKSTGRTTLETSEFLNANGHNSYIVYSEGHEDANGYKMNSNFDKKAHALLSRLSGKQAYFSTHETKHLLKYIDQIKPDVVHLRNLHSNYINLNLLLRYLAVNDVATVLTLHDCWFYTGKCTHYTLDDCDKWKTGCNNCPRLKKDNPSWFFDRTFQMHQDKKRLFGAIPRLAVVGVSDWITEEAKQSVLNNSLIVSRIYNWVDLSIFKPTNTEALKEEMNLRDKFVLLGVASTWSNTKGLDKFIELSKFLPKDNVIILVGKVADGLRLPDNIIHIEETHNIKELVKLYSLADVLLNLSLEESFGKVTAEALACGTPGIVIDSTANPELIGKNCGYVIGDSSFDNILDSIAKVKRLGKVAFTEHCIDYAKINFSKNDRLTDYLNLYKILISAKGAL